MIITFNKYKILNKNNSSNDNKNKIKISSTALEIALKKLLTK